MTSKKPELCPICSIILFVALVFMMFGATSLIWIGLNWTVQHFGL